MSSDLQFALLHAHADKDTHRCVVTALRDIVLYGFAQLGLLTSDAEEVLQTLASDGDARAPQ